MLISWHNTNYVDSSIDIDLWFQDSASIPDSEFVLEYTLRLKQNLYKLHSLGFHLHSDSRFGTIIIKYDFRIYRASILAWYPA